MTSPAVQLFLLGCPRVSSGVLLPLSKATALLAYLAIRADWVTRDELLALFYPNSGESSARNSLRQLLSRAKDSPLATALEVEQQRLRLPVQTDLAVFYAALEQQNQLQAVQFNPELLEGLWLTDEPELMSWLESERSSIRHKWRETALQFCQSSEEDVAVPVLRRILKTDPLCETAVQIFLERGTREEALGIFENFCAVLHNECALKPKPETNRLAQLLHQQITSHNLPFSITPFIGRDDELQSLQAILGHPLARLITVVGLGGMGKTRLALQAASAWLEAGLDGVYLVQLADVQTTATLPSAIAGALNLRIHDHAESELLAFLRPKHILLILDNFEHLDLQAEFVRQMLEQCSLIKLLVTSRVPLEIYGQWLFDLHGFNQNHATQLFWQAAQRFAPQLDTTDHASVCQIVAYLGGMPLAIELAAYWTRLLMPAEILAELERGLKLESSSAALPPRQRAVDLLLSQSYQRLSQTEQRTLRRFTVFRGGASLPAARAITEASVDGLQRLQDYGLLRQTDQRLDMHELLRQFVRAQISPLEWQDCLMRHGQYYCHFFVSAIAQIERDPMPTIALLGLEYPNAEVALPYFLRFDLAWQFEGFADIFMVFLRLRGLFGVALELLQHSLEQPDLELQNRVFMACILLRSKQPQAAAKQFEQLIALITPNDPVWGFAWLEYGATLAALNDFTNAQPSFELALTAFSKTNSSINIVRSHVGLALCALHLGLPDCQEHAQTAIAVAQENGITFINGDLYSTVGKIFWALQTPDAPRYLQYALDFYITVKDFVAAQNLAAETQALGVPVQFAMS